MNKIVFTLALSLAMAAPMAAQTVMAADSDFTTTQQQMNNETRQMRNEARQDVIEARDKARQEVNEARNEADENIRKARMDANEKIRDAEKDYNEAKRDAAKDYRDAKMDAKEDHQSVSEYVDDASITAAVKAKFLGQKGLDSMDISVKTIDGVVTLDGVTKHASQAELAKSTAAEVKGVKEVRSNLLSEDN